MESFITHETRKAIFQISTQKELVITFSDLVTLHRKLSTGVFDDGMGKVLLQMSIQCVNKSKMGPDTNIQEGGLHTAIDQQALVGDLCLHYMEQIPKIPFSNFPLTHAGMKDFSGYLFTMGKNYIQNYRRQLSTDTSIPMKRVDKDGKPLTVDAKDGNYKTGKTKMIAVEHHSIDAPLLDEEGEELESTIADSRYPAEKYLEQVSFDDLYNEHRDTIKRKVSGSHGNKHLRLLLDDVYERKQIWGEGIVNVRKDSSGLPIVEFVQHPFINLSNLTLIPIELFGVVYTLALPVGVDEDLVLYFEKTDSNLSMKAYSKETLEE